MGKNVGLADRIIRIILGLAILSLVFIGPQTVWGYLGLIAMLSAVSGFCPMYGLFGVNSCQAQKK